ncbi:hypothetical protein Sjap_001338 [Stephania japonica]|uniref:Uncharacterized protein n=1 Tax=Stephania japonica TaxID=461633 RepID=A0AAP0KLA2_9MAGN
MRSISIGNFSSALVLLVTEFNRLANEAPLPIDSPFHRQIGTPAELKTTPDLTRSRDAHLRSTNGTEIRTPLRRLRSRKAQRPPPEKPRQQRRSGKTPERPRRGTSAIAATNREDLRQGERWRGDLMQESFDEHIKSKSSFSLFRS